MLYESLCECVVCVCVCVCVCVWREPKENYENSVKITGPRVDISCQGPADYR